MNESCKDPYSILMRAAQWAEKIQEPLGCYAPSWEILREIAERVRSGELDLSDMPDTLETPWSGPVRYLLTKGIDVAALAHARAGSVPMFNMVFCEVD